MTTAALLPYCHIYILTCHIYIDYFNVSLEENKTGV